MSQALRIAVADDEQEMRDFLTESLSEMGHTVASASANGRELVESCRRDRPDLVITDIRMPELDGIEAAQAICRDEPLPLILVSAFSDREYVERAAAEHVFGYLVKPIRGGDLGPAIAIALGRFEQFQLLRRDADNLRQALEDRKIIERAKGVLMKKADLDEQEAFKRLQKLARVNQRKLVDMAQLFLDIEDTLYAPEEKERDKEKEKPATATKGRAAVPRTNDKRNAERRTRNAEG